MANKNLKSYDHYVSQTYLKHFFYKEGYVYVYRKKEEFEKSLPIISICGKKGGDIIEHFSNPFGLRNILSSLEKEWNLFIERVKKEELLCSQSTEQINEEPSFLQKIRLYIAYLRCLSPTTNRLAKEQQDAIYTSSILPKIAELKKDELGDTVLESIRRGEFKLSIGDEQYYKSMGVNSLGTIANKIYGRDWEILVNLSDTKFITSDTPMTIIAPSGNVSFDYIAPMYLPLTPEYALLIHSNLGVNVGYRKVIRSEVKEYNKEVVKWAEDMIISSTKDSGISKLVHKYRYYCAQIELHKIETGSSDLIFCRHKSSLKESSE